MRSPVQMKTWLVGSVVAGVGASICCVGPLLLLSLGIGGAWIGSLTALEPYRPAFILLAVVFFFLAFRKLYLVPVACETGTDCIADRGGSSLRITFWIVTLLMLGLIATPWLMPLFYR